MRSAALASDRRRRFFRGGSSWLSLVPVGLVIFLGACEDKKLVLRNSNTYNAFCLEWADARCTWARSCCEIEDLVELLALPADDASAVQFARQALFSHASCRDVAHGLCEKEHRLFLDAMLAERVALDQQAFESCLGLYRDAAMSCNIGRATASEVTRQCSPERLFVGRRQKGEPCHREWECDEDTTCSTSFDPTSVPGVCVARVAEGSACQSESMCGAGQTCSARDLERQWCDRLPRQTVGQWCFEDSQCEDGLICDAQQETCVARLAPEAACVLDVQCLSGHCSPETQRCAGFEGLGDSCDTDAECGAGAWCNPLLATALCSASTADEEVVEACSSAGELTCGEEGGTCPKSGRCEARADRGEPCREHAACMVSDFCDSRENPPICVPRPGLQEDCSGGGLCVAGAHCVTERTCEPLAGEGELCAAASSCAEGLYCHESWAVCLPLGRDLPAGKTCRANEECGSGVCQGNVCVAACIGGLWQAVATK